jgi:hypothetical protein
MYMQCCLHRKFDYIVLVLLLYRRSNIDMYKKKFDNFHGPLTAVLTSESKFALLSLKTRLLSSIFVSENSVFFNDI